MVSLDVAMWMDGIPVDWILGRSEPFTPTMTRWCFLLQLVLVVHSGVVAFVGPTPFTATQSWQNPAAFSALTSHHQQQRRRRRSVVGHPRSSLFSLSSPDDPPDTPDTPEDTDVSFTSDDGDDDDRFPFLGTDVPSLSSPAVPPSSSSSFSLPGRPPRGLWNTNVPIINVAVSVGRVGRDPVAKRFPGVNGRPERVVVNTVLACKRKYHPMERRVRGIKSGAEETDWFPLEMWGRDAEYCEKYVKRGARIGIRGSLKVDRWTDKDGRERRSSKILVKSLDILETKAEAELRNRNFNRGGGRDTGFFGDGGGAGGAPGGGGNSGGGSSSSSNRDSKFGSSKDSFFE